MQLQDVGSRGQVAVAVAQVQQGLQAFKGLLGSQDHLVRQALKERRALLEPLVLKAQQA
jgi:hypothetical protein